MVHGMTQPKIQRVRVRALRQAMQMLPHPELEGPNVRHIKVDKYPSPPVTAAVPIREDGTVELVGFTFMRQTYGFGKRQWNEWELEVVTE